MLNRMIDIHIHIPVYLAYTYRCLARDKIFMKLKEQEAHGPHRSPAKTVQIIKQI